MHFFTVIIKSDEFFYDKLGKITIFRTNIYLSIMAIRVVEFSIKG